MSSTDSASRLPTITARPTPAEKEHFASVAASRGMSESTLALVAIRSLLLDCNDVAATNAVPARRERSTDRVTIRLRPGDRRAINERASRRGIKASAYLAALVRAHIATNPPLTEDELGAYKHGVVLLAGLGRLLTRISRDAAQAGSVPQELQQELIRIQAAVAGLEKRTHELARAALVSWESRYD